MGGRHRPKNRGSSSAAGGGGGGEEPPKGPGGKRAPDDKVIILRKFAAGLKKMIFLDYSSQGEEEASHVGEQPFS